jgi:uncharacterized protein YwgA
MNPGQRQALLLALIDQLHQHDSWCGETHIQKSAYFLQELLGVPLDFNFIFYNYGPFSFDLNDAITALRCDRLLTVKPRDPYGASLLPSEEASDYLDRFPKTRKKHEAAIRFVAKKLGDKKVADLERLATALFVQLESADKTAEKQAAEVHRRKPHVSMEQARAALAWVNEMRDEVEQIDSD